MILIRLFLLVLLLVSVILPQDATKLAVIQENNYLLINAENQTGTMYVSLNELAGAISLPILNNNNANSATLVLSLIHISEPTRPY